MTSHLTVKTKHDNYRKKKLQGYRVRYGGINILPSMHGNILMQKEMKLKCSWYLHVCGPHAAPDGCLVSCNIRRAGGGG